MSPQELEIKEEQQVGDSNSVEAPPPNSQPNSQDSNEREVIDLLMRKKVFYLKLRNEEY